MRQPNCYVGLINLILVAVMMIAVPVQSSLFHFSHPDQTEAPNHVARPASSLSIGQYNRSRNPLRNGTSSTSRTHPHPLQHDISPFLHWVFFHYHKSGHDFTISLSQAIRKQCHSFHIHERDGYKRQNDLDAFFLPRFGSIFGNHDVYVTVPGAYATNWTTTFTSPQHRFRIVHLVRDPYEMVLSAYRFHSQLPIPEDWINRQAIDYCSGTFVGENFVTTTRPLGVFHGQSDVVEEWVRQAMRLCRQTSRMFHPLASYHEMLNKSASLWEYTGRRNLRGTWFDWFSGHKPAAPVASPTLSPVRVPVPAVSGGRHVRPVRQIRPTGPAIRHTYQDNAYARNYSLPINRTEVQAYLAGLAFYEHNATAHGPDLYPAIRIEALHSMFSDMGDILHMAVTKLYQEPSLAMSMTLAQFGVGDPAVFDEAARKMFTFLLPPHRNASASEHSGCRGRLCNCLSVNEGVNLLRKACFLSGNHSHGNHGVLFGGRNDSASGNETSNVKPQHVTSHLMRRELTQLYKARLAADPVLGPLLQLVAKIIHTEPQDKALIHFRAGEL